MKSASQGLLASTLSTQDLSFYNQCQGSNSMKFVNWQLNYSQPTHTKSIDLSTQKVLFDFQHLLREAVYFYWDHRSSGWQWTDWSPAAAAYSPRLPGAWGGNVFRDAREYLPLVTCYSSCRGPSRVRSCHPPRPWCTLCACAPPPPAPPCASPSFCPRVCSLCLPSPL